MTPNQFMTRWLVVDLVFILFLLWAYNCLACGDVEEPEPIEIKIVVI